MPDDNPFSPENLSSALSKLDDLPKNQVHGGVVVQDGQLGVEAEGSVDVGKKGVFVEGEASWFKRTGWRAAAMLGWRKRG